jgi:L-ascorbate 6-phosphate lactonase
MIDLARQIRELVIPTGSLGIFWLGQAGFVFKTSDGKIIVTDPYLTASVQEALPEYGFGFKRLTPSLLEPEEVEADTVISTHSHADHFDVQAVPVIARSPRPHFIGAPDCRDLYLQAGVPSERFTILHTGERLDLDGVQLSGVYADHGELAPEALGLWFDFGGITVWQVGDSAYRPDAWPELFERGVDVLIPPINGAFGNLNEEDAARLAGAAHARVVIPCHFWTFPLHGGDPAKFLEACKQHAPEVRPLLMAQGECLIYRP